MKIFTFACTALLGLWAQPAYPRQEPVPESDISGARLAIALTNDVLIAGSNTLLRCWITNNSPSGLVLERGPGEDSGVASPGQHHLGVWLRGEAGKEYVLARGPGSGFRVSRMVEVIQRGEVRSYRVSVPIAAGIPPGRYQLRAKREIRGPGSEVLSNILDVQVELGKPER